MRRMMLRGSGEKKAESLVTVDTNLQNPYDSSYKYFYKIIIKDALYYYCANSPFYALKNDKGIMFLIPDDTVRYSEKEKIELKSHEGFDTMFKINGQLYRKDWDYREQSITDTAISNYPILEVTPPTDSSDEIFI